jgi:hypothetical protein
MKAILLGLLMCLGLNVGPIGQDWKTIKPLHSTCEDVKRTLKVDKCVFPMSEYHVPGFRIVVFFSENKDCKEYPRGWRVPPGTVTSVIVHPDEEILPSTLGFDISKYRRWEDGEIVGVEHYESPQEGVLVDLFHGFVQTLYVRPNATQEHLRCEPLKNVKPAPPTCSTNHD